MLSLASIISVKSRVQTTSNLHPGGSLSVSVNLGSSVMASSGRSTPISKAGITSDANGESYIPSSTRADGSVRREIRVRPGYKPPEDVEVYKNRAAESWKSKGKGGVPGAEFVETSKTSKPKKKPAKKSESGNTDVKVNGEFGVEASDNVQKEAKIVEKKEEPEIESPEVKKQKEARKLSKKLRQAREIESKKDGGGSLLPEQFEKLIKINELIRQLDKLGFDEEGQRKPDTPDG